MKLCSYEVKGKASYGAAGADGGIVDLGSRIGARYPTLLSIVQEDALAQARAEAGKHAPDYREAEVRFLPVFQEGVAVHCIGLNYAAHTAEAGMQQPDFPRTFVKVQASLVGHNEALEMPTLSTHFDFEGELAVVIGKTARNVKTADALNHVFGYACFNDGSVRDYQIERTVDQGKNFFRSSSMGPYLVTIDEVGPLGKLTVTTRLSGEQMQHSSFDKMIFSVPVLIEYLSAITELRPGDVIATGTPEGVGFKRKPPRFMRPGDTLEIVIDRVGTLRNPIV